MTTKRLLLCSLLTTGLAVTQTPDAPKVKVYVYPAQTTSGYTFDVYANQTVIATVRKKKTYFVNDLDPGRYLIYGNRDTKHGITVELIAGRDYYISCLDDSAAHASVWIGRLSIPCMLMEEQQGRSDIATFTLTPLRNKR